jgi:transcriptional regulator with XRE-family HTH domain
MTLTLGENIRAARKAMKMSQDELADAIGANRVTISQYERGVYLPSLPALDRLSDALHLSPAQLTGGAKPATNAPQTVEARIVSDGMDNMPKDKREKIVAVLRAMYPDEFGNLGD